jgi:hypothetical protein
MVAPLPTPPDMDCASFASAPLRPVARQLGKVCLVACPNLEIDLVHRQRRIGGTLLNEGDFLSLDGDTGAVHAGKLEPPVERPERALGELAAGGELPQERGTSRPRPPRISWLGRRFSALRAVIRRSLDRRSQDTWTKMSSAMRPPMIPWRNVGSSGWSNGPQVNPR